MTDDDNTMMMMTSHDEFLEDSGVSPLIHPSAPPPSPNPSMNGPLISFPLSCPPLVLNDDEHKGCIDELVTAAMAAADDHNFAPCAAVPGKIATSFIIGDGILYRLPEHKMSPLSGPAFPAPVSFSSLVFRKPFKTDALPSEISDSITTLAKALSIVDGGACPRTLQYALSISTSWYKAECSGKTAVRYSSSTIAAAAAWCAYKITGHPHQLSVVATPLGVNVRDVLTMRLVYQCKRDMEACDGVVVYPTDDCTCLYCRHEL